MRHFYFLCGFMGSGKSSLLRRLSDSSTEASLLDLDDMLFRRLGLEGEASLGDVIRRLGWQDFRKAEKELLEKILLSSAKETVVALGGGALDDREILSSILKNQSVTLVWLNIPFSVCFQRISNGDQGLRPLVGELSEQELKLLYEKRSEIYKFSHKELSLEEINSIRSFADFKQAAKRE